MAAYKQNTRATRARRSTNPATGGAVVSLPDRIKPMLPRLGEPFDSDRHLFEVKWDGTRCLTYVETGRLRLLNRRYVQILDRYPELAGLARLPAGTILDGEIIILDQGKPSFARLQRREHVIDPRRIAMLSERMPAVMMVFDLLYVRGQCIMHQPLTERRKRLTDLIAGFEDAHVLVPDYVIGEGKQYFAAAEAMGLEGIVGKRLDSTKSLASAR